MALRNIYTVNATQVVISESHPEGLLSVVSGYPKNYDSRSYDATEENPNGNTDKALNAAKSEYYDRLSKIYVGSDTRVMATVTLSQADGKIIIRDSIGAFPDMTPAPAPEPEAEEEQ